MVVRTLQTEPVCRPVDKPTCLLESGYSVVLQMPTGSGKTYRASQAIREAVRRGYRAIYVCPTRALANELYARWTADWSEVRVGLFTGDFGSEVDYPVPFKVAQVLVMTAERFDICTRQWRHHWTWLPQVDVVVVDELHLLADPQRGPRLEGSIVRCRSLNPFVRVVGLSATLGNAGELADWLDGACYVSRSRPIETVWQTVTFSRADEKPRKLLAALEPVIQSSGMSLVFVQSKRRAESLALFLQEAGTLVWRALDANLLDAGNIQVRPDPPGEVFVGGLLDLLVQQAVVKLCDARLQRLAQSVDLATREPRPSVRQIAANLRQETVAMKPTRAVTHGEDVNVARRLEAGSRREECFRFHYHVIPKRT